MGGPNLVIDFGKDVGLASFPPSTPAIQNQKISCLTDTIKEERIYGQRIYRNTRNFY